MTNWRSWRVVELKAELSSRRLPATGHKAVLVQRLTDDDEDLSSALPLGGSASASDGPPDDHYIPAGCLVFPPSQAHEVHGYRGLAKQEWIRLETIDSQDSHFVITRVYILPDDRDHGRINRDDPKLQQTKKKLVAALDFNAATWNGAFHVDALANFPSLSPAARLFVGNHVHGASLLNTFNTIPSPEPDTDMIDDKHDRDDMCRLLEGAVSALTTEMYSYQCRSAAFMHQKEVQPCQFLDPRLVQVVHQSGGFYYYDSVTGHVFREPRYYDGVRGGILAEEMGTGKTLICLALIAATKHQPAYVPDIYQGNNYTVRPRVGSLMDMAAAVATKYANPWRRHIDNARMIKALNANPGWYYLPCPEKTRPVRGTAHHPPPQKIYLSHATLVVVPANLLQQWLQEISKHTQGLKVHVIGSKNPAQIPGETELLEYDIILVSVQVLEAIWQDHQRRAAANGLWVLTCGLGRMRFKRCIVDEGHKLGNVKLSGIKTDVLRALDMLQIDYRWIATGTPAHGLFGMEEGSENKTSLAESTALQERDDVERIGAITTHYLKARPWSNTNEEPGDRLADWSVYMMQRRHSSHSRGRSDCLRSTFDSMIVRHRLSEVSSLLPAVDVKVVELEGSYQDKLCLNLFSMMIIFNLVQSQRTDQDYLFHKSNRKSLLELVINLRQASFYGGAFFAAEDIQTALKTAEAFLEKAADMAISEQDRKSLRAAIAHGNLAKENSVKQHSKTFHEPPIYVKEFPSSHDMPPALVGSWSIDGKEESGVICTNWKLMVAAQQSLRPFLEETRADGDIDDYLQWGFWVASSASRQKLVTSQNDNGRPKKGTTLAGNTSIGEDHVNPRNRHSASIKTQFADDSIPTPPRTPEKTLEMPGPIANTKVISTSSAKLSYLVDAIITHSKEEQIIVFYDNDNIAWYLAGMLEMLAIHHLIYAKSLTAKRRSQYVSTFNNSSKFRVLLMDIKQAAFGLDMRAASRVYFVSPVLNPQVEAQAIGRVRRISQQKRVTVEILVLKDSIEEVIVERKKNMTQAEHRSCKTILHDGSIFDWIRNAKMMPMPDVDVKDGPAQMAPLKFPQYVFGRHVGRERSNPDEGVLLQDASACVKAGGASGSGSAAEHPASESRPAKRARFADDLVGMI